MIELVNEKLSTQGIADRLGRSKTSVRHWLKKYDLKTFRSNSSKNTLRSDDVKLCFRCNETKSLEHFYRRRENAEASAYCKLCTNSQTIERQRNFKSKCIEYKGGSCSELPID